MLTGDDYRAVFEASPDGCLIVDDSGTILVANRQAELLFEWSVDDLVGMGVDALVPESLGAAHARHRARFAEDPRSRPMGVGLNLRARRSDGSTFPVEVSLSRLPAHDLGLRVICTVRDVSEQRRLRNFSEGALNASEDERQRIARELHDDTAQRLATLILRVRRLAHEADDDSRRELWNDVREEIVDTADGVRRMARGLRPPELEELGLPLALQAHFRGLREAGGFEVEAELEPVGPSLSSTAKLALYRIVQEAVSNARRHSGERTARVRLSEEDDRVVVTVTDDGLGFDWPVGAGGERGLGLIGMQERATMVGGRLDVVSAPGKGTTVTVTVPFDARSRGSD